MDSGLDASHRPGSTAWPRLIICRLKPDAAEVVTVAGHERESSPVRNSRTGDHRTACFRNCRLVAGSIAMISARL
jgi:hypothetical protein